MGASVWTRRDEGVVELRNENVMLVMMVMTAI